MKHAPGIALGTAVLAALVVLGSDPIPFVIRHLGSPVVVMILTAAFGLPVFLSGRATPPSDEERRQRPFPWMP